jgi:hypothetical protein
MLCRGWRLSSFPGFVGGGFRTSRPHSGLRGTSLGDTSRASVLHGGATQWARNCRAKPPLCARAAERHQCTGCRCRRGAGAEVAPNDCGELGCRRATGRTLPCSGSDPLSRSSCTGTVIATGHERKSTLRNRCGACRQDRPVFYEGEVCLGGGRIRKPRSWEPGERLCQNRRV